jgi:transcriptional regulator with GAF, ATPase, and Fis domain
VREDIRDYERERIEQALAAAHGNVTRAAEMLGLPRKTLAYRVERLGLKPKR